MTDISGSFQNLSKEDRVRYALNLFHRQMIHYVLWFTEIRHQMGMEKALEMLTEVSEKSASLQLNRLSKTLGFEMKDGLPAPLLNMPDKSLYDLIESLSINWLGNDGIWFQAVEFSHGMNEAKRCNDSVWAQFSPVEAWSIKQILNMPRHPGLEGLKKALAYRLYANINTQSIQSDGPDSFVFKMNDCRVQSARKRKGLEDYPCKSAGLVEYAYFARAIDDRISTECIGCPPDAHPEEWFCAWRFYIKP
jgi:hypothetical protein